MKQPTPPLERLLDKFEINSETGCWEWTAFRSPLGYGQFWYKEHNARAHRATYEELVGPIPDGLVLDHLCRNPPCINPDHLEPVTNKENLLRGVSPMALAAQRDTCINGHPYTDANIYVRPDGQMHRGCLTCRRTVSRAVSLNRYSPERTKRLRIEAALSAHPDWTNVRIAQELGVSRATVARVRKGTPTRFHREDQT